MFQQKCRDFEKSRWTFRRQWFEVTRPSADCQNNFSLTFQAIRKFKKNSRRTVTRQWSEVTRPSTDCQTTFFLRFKQFGKHLIKVAEGSRDSGRRSRDRRQTVKQCFFDVSSNSEIFWKESLNGHATVVGGHATVGRLSNNVFSTFQAIRKFFEKVTERSRDRGRRSRDRWLTVKQRFFNVPRNPEIFWKKSLNGHATVARGHVTVGRLSNNFCSTFQANQKSFERNRWTVTQQLWEGSEGHATVGWLSSSFSVVVT